MQVELFDNIPELKPLYLSLIDTGMSTRDAGLKVILDYHKKLYDELAELKKTIKNEKPTI